MPISQELPVPQDIKARVLSFLIITKAVDHLAGSDSIRNRGNLQDLVNWSNQPGNPEVFRVRPDELGERSSDQLLQLLDCLSYLRGEISGGRIKEPAVKAGEVFGGKLEEAVWDTLERAGYPRDKTILGEQAAAYQRLEDYYIKDKKDVYKALSAEISGRKAAARPPVPQEPAAERLKKAGYDESANRLDEGTYRFFSEEKSPESRKNFDAFVRWLMGKGKVAVVQSGMKVDVSMKDDNYRDLTERYKFMEEDEKWTGRVSMTLDSELTRAVQRVIYASTRDENLRKELAAFFGKEQLAMNPGTVAGMEPVFWGGYCLIPAIKERISRLDPGPDQNKVRAKEILSDPEAFRGWQTGDSRYILDPAGSPLPLN